MKTRSSLILLIILMLVVGAVPLTSQAARKPVLYTGNITTVYGPDSTSGVYPTPDILRPKTNAKRLGTLHAGAKLEIVDVLPNYVEINYGKGTGFVLRLRVENVVALDPSTTAPYGVVTFQYWAEMSGETEVKAAPDSASDTLITLQQGAKLAFIDVTDGWARVIFKRQYGFVSTAALPDLQMVAPSLEDADKDAPLAVFNSFYDISTTEANLNRIVNLEVCGTRTDRVMQPGESLDFNRTVGPFSARNGYLQANGLFEGELVPSTGGGSCQSSSTLYNAVLQLTGLTVTARAPHGNNGAPYLPHGVDASSGDLNFIFRNDYSFPIRISSHVQDGAYYVAIYRV